ncbi:MAG: hypothetical protein ACRC3H_13645 [Lachnospiraceae bacterium]
MHKENKKLNLLIEKIATTKIILMSLLAFILVLAMVNVVFEQNFDLLTQTFNYTPENYTVFNKLVRNCLVISTITFSPLILSVTQFIEIIILTIVLLQYPNQLFTLVQIANIITMIKTILTVVFFSIPLIGLCFLGIKKIIKKV